MKHIPGPWRINEDAGPIDGEDFIEIEYEGMPICEVRGTDDMACIDEEDQPAIAAQMIATAKLIAAAPDLLEALQDLIDAQSLKKPLIDSIEKAQKAIKRATE